MKRFARQYLDLLRQPDVARLMAVAFFSRMPIGMVGFSMLMFLRETLGSFALAGSAVGVHFVAMAAAAPVLGRIIDRWGPRGPLLVTGTVHPLALLAVAAAAHGKLPYALVAAAAGFAGAFSSPITVLTRTMWRHRFRREEERRTAFALDAVLIELNFMLGPALVAIVLAAAGATFAFGLAIGVVVAAFLTFMTSRATRYFRPGTEAARHLLGPLTDPRLWIVFTATFGLTVSFGLLEVGYPAYATALAAPALGGVLLSVNSFGSAIGGALYGGLRFRSSVERQFSAAMALMGLPLFMHALVGAPLLFAGVAFLAGMLIAPSIAAQSVLVARIAPSHYATEAFTWSSTFIVTGLGAGVAFGGLLVETLGLKAAFVAAGAVVWAMALVSLLLSPSAVASEAAGE